MQDGFCTKHGCYVGMLVDQDATDAFHWFMFAAVFGFIGLLFCGGLSIAEAQAQSCNLWICDDYPAPTEPYADCPAIDGRDVTSAWVEWKRGNNTLFDSYRRSFTFYEHNGVWIAEQKHKTLPTLIYAGWWWDVEQSKDNVFVGHASCGVFLQPT